VHQHIDVGRQHHESQRRLIEHADTRSPARHEQHANHSKYEIHRADRVTGSTAALAQLVDLAAITFTRPAWIRRTGYAIDSVLFQQRFTSGATLIEFAV
jgi:hypothetical protein